MAGAAAAGATDLDLDPAPYGLKGEGRLGDRAVVVTWDDAELPPVLAVRVSLWSPTLRTLTLRGRHLGAPSTPDRVSTGDPVLDGAVAISGTTGERAAALVEGLHEPVLAVVAGAPGSTVADGAVTVRTRFVPRAAAPGSPPPDPEVALQAHVAASVRDALALAEALDRRAATLERQAERVDRPTPTLEVEPPPR